jgi:enterochelin esterase-like enzyme
MRDILSRLGVFGVFLLSAGCASTAQSVRQSSPTAPEPPIATRVFAPPAAPSSTEPPTLAWTRTPEASGTEQETKTQEPRVQETKTQAAVSQGGAACCDVTSQLSVSYVDSNVLARSVPVSVYLPPCYDTFSSRPYPVLYLLHGVNADHTQWPDLDVQPDADRLIAQGAIVPLVVVMPGGEYREGEDYGAFVLGDLLPYVEHTFHVAADRGDRAIGGVSQGGYWALELALDRPDLFGAVGGHSPATGPTLANLLEANKGPGLDTLRIYLDVGNEDPLMAGVSAFATALRQHGLAPLFHVYPGAHNRPYWRSHTEEYLRFYAEGW